MSCARISAPRAREQLHRLVGEAAAVPLEAEPARHAVDLRAAEVEAVVVELLAEPQPVRAALVEGEVDHRALRPQRPHRGVEAGGVGAGLEHDVGAAIVAAVEPARLGVRPGLVLGHRGDAEAFGAQRGGRARGRRSRLRSRPAACANSAVEHADDAGADHQRRAAADAVAQVDDVRPEQFGVGVQDAVGGDRPHLADIDAEDRVDARAAAWSAGR